MEDFDHVVLKEHKERIESAIDIFNERLAQLHAQVEEAKALVYKVIRDLDEAPATFTGGPKRIDELEFQVKDIIERMAQ